MRMLLVWVAAAALVVAGCSEGEKSAGPTAGGAGPDGAVTPAPKANMLVLSSTAFNDGEAIPQKHTGEGADVSPPLAWVGVPEGTKELALICDDPDAPGPKPWVHAVVHSIPAGCSALGEDDTGGGLYGRNSWGRDEYGGPMPPQGDGVHHYHFALYALDAKLALSPGATKEKLLAAMKGHILATAKLIGTYERK